MIEANEAFAKAVKAYRTAINDSYYSREGDEPDKRAAKQAVIEQFKKCSPDLKYNHLFLTLKTLNQPTIGQSKERLNLWLQELANELIDVLEKL